jgi:hypothetical protein
VREIDSRVALAGFDEPAHLLPDPGNFIRSVVRDGAVAPGEDFHDVWFSLISALDEDVRRDVDEVQTPRQVPMFFNHVGKGGCVVGFYPIDDYDGFRVVCGNRIGGGTFVGSDLWLFTPLQERLDASVSLLQQRLVNRDAPRRVRI